MTRNDILLSAIAILLFALPAAPVAGSTPTLSVEPADTTVCTFEAFSVRIRICDSTQDLMGWDLRVAYDGNVLAVVAVT